MGSAYKEFYVVPNPPLLPSGVGEVIQRAKANFPDQLLEILYDPEIPWFKCITKSQDHEKVSRFIEELLLEIIESELAPVDPDIPGGARDEKGGLVDLDVISDDPRVVPWATYADWASARYNDYDNFRYPVALQECPHKAVWRGFEKFPESAVHDIILDFMDTISLVCGSFMVPTEVEHLGPYLGCGDVLRNLTQTLLFIGGNTQSSIDGAIGRLDNIFALMQHRSDVSNSRHIIALGADHDSIRLSYRWLTHLGLVKRTYLSDELHGLLLTPDKGGRNDVSEGASLRVARKRNEHMWDVDLTSYSHTRQSEPGQANSLGPFDKFRYTQKAPGLLRNRPNTNQTAAKRLQPGVRDSKTKIPTSYASAAGGAGRGHSQTRPAAPALRAPSTTTSEVSGAGRVTSTAPSASSNSRPPTLVERVLANRPKAPRNQNNGQDSATKLHLQKWVDEIGASNQQDLGDLISFDEPNQAGLTPSSPPPPPVASATPSSSKKTERLGGSKEDVSGNLLDEGSDHSEDLIDFGPSDEPVDQPGFNIQNETHGKINPELVGESDLQAQFGREETSVIEFHETMNQKAGRRSQAKNQQGSACQPLPGASKPPVPGAPPKPDDSLGMSSSAPSALLKSQLLNDMKARVQSVAQNLQIVSGEVGLEIKIGRLYIRNPLSSTISANAVVSSDLVWKLDAATQELHQISPKDIGFQPVLSARGADANLLVQLREPGEPRWNPPTTSVVYRFICRHVGTGIWFKVDVDTVSFAHICQGLDEEVENVYIHCPECAWDMKICATRARIEFPEQYAKDFAKFAEGLIKSLEVSTDSNGVTSVKAAGNAVRGYDIREACVVHLARYQSRSSDGRLLALRMTRPVFRTNNDSDTGSFQGIVGLPSERKNRAGFVSEWFEASLRSAKAEKAFELNKSLQTGEKAGWTGEELNEAGVFDGLCRLGLSLIPKMDSIGIANDNGYHPSMTTDARAQASSEDYAAYEPGFW